jgi:nucleotide-binding universal stress UspA family protein
MESNGSNSRERPFRVVVGIDFSTAGDGAMARALALANAHPQGEVHAVSVIEPLPVTHGQELPSNAAVQLQEMAKTAVATLTGSGEPVHIRRVVTHLLTGSPAREIVWLAAHVDADLIVIGTHGRQGLKRMVLGSVAEEVLRSAGCMVLVVRAKNHPLEWREPEIEPPCDDCVAQRKASQGAELWCRRHSGHHPHGHVYSWSGGDTSAAQPWGFTR